MHIRIMVGFERFPPGTLLNIVPSNQWNIYILYIKVVVLISVTVSSSSITRTSETNCREMSDCAWPALLLVGVYRLLLVPPTG